MSYVEVDGVVRHEHQTSLVTMKPHRSITVDEAVLFEVEYEGRYMIGGLLVEAK